MIMKYEAAVSRHARFCKTSAVLSVVMFASAYVIGGTYCLKGPGVRCTYQPTPTCSNDWMCSKTCTTDLNYGFGECVDTGRSEDKCEDPIIGVAVDKYLGKCSTLPNGNCSCFPGVYKSWIDGRNFSHDISPCAGG